MKQLIKEAIREERNKRLMKHLIARIMSQQFVVNCTTGEKETTRPYGVSFFIYKGNAIYSSIFIKSDCEDWRIGTTPDVSIIKEMAEYYGIKVDTVHMLNFKKEMDVIEWFKEEVQKNPDIISKHFLFVRPNRKVGDFNFLFDSGLTS
jgi:hypothetical protein